MTILVSHALRETWIVGIVLLLTSALTIRQKKATEIFPVSTTIELKGLAILFVILSHLGYFLVSDHQFLVPFSNYAGVGVDLFLILSGYGLAASALKRPLSPLPFYKKRLLKIWLPAALTLIIFLLADFLILHKTYSLNLTIKNFFGFFPKADVNNDINSPLWFITPLLFFYILFPIIFHRRFPFLSGAAFALLGWYLAEQPLRQFIPSLTEGVESLWRLHALSFGVGIMLAALINRLPAVILSPFDSLCSLRVNSAKNLWLIRIAMVLAATIIWYYYSLHSPVGPNWHHERRITTAMSLAAIAIFLAKPVTFKLFSLFGQYSFEMYLLHWPLLYRHFPLFQYLPASIATILGILICLAFAWLFQKITSSHLPRLTTAIRTRMLTNKPF